MELSSLMGVDLMSAFESPTISSGIATGTDTLIVDQSAKSEPFSNVFDSALNLINQTNAYSNAAEEEAIKFELGETDSIHDLQIAQQKANVSLQYTVAVRDAFMSAYREIMNIQF